MRHYLIALAFFLGLTSIAEAAQIRIAEDNAEIAAVISATEVNRIALQGDRVASISVVPVGFSVDHDDTTGDIFIVPLLGNQLVEPINLFLTSESGFTYQLLLQPRDIPSEQILIRNRSLKSKATKKAPHKQELAYLIRAVITGEILSDYYRSGVDDSDFLLDPDILPVEIWQGDRFQAIRIRSISGNPLTDLQFLSPMPVAIWQQDDEGIIVMEVSDAN